MSLLNSLERIVTIQTKRYDNIYLAQHALESLATDYFHIVCMVETRRGTLYLNCGGSVIPIKIRRHYCGMYCSLKVVFRTTY